MSPSSLASPLLRVLLVEDEPDHADLIRRHLDRSRSRGVAIALEHVDRLELARQRLAESDRFDVVLLDLVLPDSSLGTTLDLALNERPDLPIVVLTSLDDLDLASGALQRGAQDYLVKSEINSESLVRSIRYAIERKAAQRQLHEYALQLERRNEDLRQFAHLLAHEVRNPLNLVSLNLMLARKSAGDALLLSQAITQAEESVRSLGELVADLLRFAESENERAELEVVSLDEVLSDVLESLRESLIEHRVEVRSGSLPVVDGNRRQLDHLFQNLIANAVKYRSEAPPVIRIEAEPAEDGQTLFRVIDNGLGITPEDRDRVFEMFCRVHQPRPIPGTGIGLAFCKRVVESHGGRIWVESPPLGAGSAFCFTLPTANVPGSEPGAGAEAVKDG